ncbi:putative ribosomal RNA large subunit methyltransferase N [Cavenderia fasciculata]|uniref:Ribosomal RNA large subunit methyltransferase N n=1 Tax=Cavenderia fasciculata TaxID=261658 RepID=F4QAW2_CACFS|nr:putative ribosomal RNA large subunit methyltransferase N [Cavenderia fasciculata]EGG15021.1 putative ribosomal RNA large subunit methyltransferase N [Cavenderia fasciculata]|eukprot:XP_004351741.1 putative ribosomal RNA large subunit methyltransferase N [Cavenderia fasciculata]
MLQFRNNRLLSIINKSTLSSSSYTSSIFSYCTCSSKKQQQTNDDSTTITSTTSLKTKKNLIGLSKEEIETQFETLGLEKYRAKQVWKWIYNKGTKNIDHIDNLSKKHRDILSEVYNIDHGVVNKDSLSIDGTRKLLVEFKGDEVETVFIPERNRGTLCISSQVGCTFQCTFCHTGTQKLVRNLTAGEIVSQVFTARSLMHDFGPTTNKRLLTNVVLMGQGEPLYNYRNVSKALKILTDGEGISISKSKITLSTSGVVPLIERLGQDFPGIGLAISLHASNNKTRSEIVPINQQWPIEELVQACINFTQKYTKDRITIEYVMLKGINDAKQDAYNLIQLASQFPSLINLIPFNPWPGTIYECTPIDQIESFARILERGGLKVTVRQPRGTDILAACGQLVSSSQKKKGIIIPEQEGEVIKKDLPLKSSYLNNV